LDRTGDATVARLAGEIDMSNAQELGDAISSRVTGDARAVIIDLSELNYIDSSGLAMLFELERRLTSRRQTLRIVVPPGASIRRALELGGLDASANVDTSMEAARSALGGSA
jgi:anti-sigma B factor antagonist